MASAGACLREHVVEGNRNRKLLISRAPTKAKSQEPAFSQALNQNKIGRQRSRSRESGRQTVRRLRWMVFGVALLPSLLPSPLLSVKSSGATATATVKVAPLQ